MTNYASHWLTFVANGDDPEQGRILIRLPARNDADTWRAGMIQAALLTAGHECTAEYEVSTTTGPSIEDGMTISRSIVTRAPVELPKPPPIRFAIPEPPVPSVAYSDDCCNGAFDTGWDIGWRAGAERMATIITNHLNLNEGEQSHGRPVPRPPR